LNLLKGSLKNLKIKIMWKIFKKQIEFSDKLIFVSDETKNDVFEKTKLKKESLVVPNYASFTLNHEAKTKEIVFVGKITRPLIKEKEILKKLIENGFTFKIIGMDSNLFNDIPHIYTNFLPYEKMMKELSKASFSLISYQTVNDERYKNDTLALPHKFFDSIAAETPVIVKDTFVSMKKLVEKYGIEVVINPNNVDDSVEKIIKAYENYHLLIENIKKHKDKFVWNEEKEKEFEDFVLK
jgi:hypothetical protein